jgi:hypothetical protein
MPRGVPSQYNASLSLEIFNHHLSEAKQQGFRGRQLPSIMNMNTITS